jgi:hypothetical protein
VPAAACAACFFLVVIAIGKRVVREIRGDELACVLGRYDE